MKHCSVWNRKTRNAEDNIKWQESTVQRNTGMMMGNDGTGTGVQAK